MPGYDIGDKVTSQTPFTQGQSDIPAGSEGEVVAVYPNGSVGVNFNDVDVPEFEDGVLANEEIICLTSWLVNETKKEEQELAMAEVESSWVEDESEIISTSIAGDLDAEDLDQQTAEDPSKDALSLEGDEGYIFPYAKRKQAAGETLDESIKQFYIEQGLSSSFVEHPDAQEFLYHVNKGDSVTEGSNSAISTALAIHFEDNDFGRACDFLGDNLTSLSSRVADFQDPSDFGVGDKVTFQTWDFLNSEGPKQSGSGTVTSLTDTVVDDGGPESGPRLTDATEVEIASDDGSTVKFTLGYEGDCFKVFASKVAVGTDVLDVIDDLMSMDMGRDEIQEALVVDCGLTEEEADLALEQHWAETFGDDKYLNGEASTVRVGDWVEYDVHDPFESFHRTYRQQVVAIAEDKDLVVQESDGTTASIDPSTARLIGRKIDTAKVACREQFGTPQFHRGQRVHVHDGEGEVLLFGNVTAFHASPYGWEYQVTGLEGKAAQDLVSPVISLEDMQLTEDDDVRPGIDGELALDASPETFGTDPIVPENQDPGYIFPYASKIASDDEDDLEEDGEDDSEKSEDDKKESSRKVAFEDGAEVRLEDHRGDILPGGGEQWVTVIETDPMGNIWVELEDGTDKKVPADRLTASKTASFYAYEMGPIGSDEDYTGEYLGPFDSEDEAYKAAEVYPDGAEVSDETPDSWFHTEVQTFGSKTALEVLNPGLSEDEVWDISMDGCDEEDGNSSEGPFWVGRVGQYLLREDSDGNRSVAEYDNVEDAQRDFQAHVDEYNQETTASKTADQYGPSIEETRRWLEVENIYRVEYDRAVGPSNKVDFVDAVDEEDARSTALPGQTVIDVRRATSDDAEEAVEGDLN